MHLKELKKKSSAELVEMAEELGVESASTLRRQDLIFAILVDAYIRLSPMHRIAWEFEFASNAPLYRDGVVPGDPGRAGEEQYWDEREGKWKAVVL